MKYADPLLPILDTAVGLATNGLDFNQHQTWRLDDLNRRIVQMNEQLAIRKTLPPELTDSYRDEIDAVTLENTLLAEKLKQTVAAMNVAKEAYKEETLHTRALEERLDVLEQRLLNALRGNS